VTSPRKEFAIPLELLRAFRGDVRIFPIDPHPNGYITFDREMLISVLEHGNDAQRVELANALKKMAKAGGELVIMQK
jgi:hypothetical protein